MGVITLINLVVGCCFFVRRILQYDGTYIPSTEAADVGPTQLALDDMATGMNSHCPLHSKGGHFNHLK